MRLALSAFMLIVVFLHTGPLALELISAAVVAYECVVQQLGLARSGSRFRSRMWLAIALGVILLGAMWHDHLTMGETPTAALLNSPRLVAANLFVIFGAVACVLAPAASAKIGLEAEPVCTDTGVALVCPEAEHQCLGTTTSRRPSRRETAWHAARPDPPLPPLFRSVQRHTFRWMSTTSSLPSPSACSHNPPAGRLCLTLVPANARAELSHAAALCDAQLASFIRPSSESTPWSPRWLSWRQCKANGAFPIPVRGYRNRV